MTVTMTVPTAVRDLLDSTLALTAQTLDDTEGAEDAPTLQYIAHGNVTAAPACPELSVRVATITPKLVDPTLNRCAVIMQTTIAVELLRCVPGIVNDRLPSADEESAANRQLAVDGWSMLKGLTRAWRDGSFPPNADCKSVTWLTCEPRPDQGGLGGWRITFRVDMA